MLSSLSHLQCPREFMCVHQQLSMGHEQWYIHPTLGRGSHGWEKDLQFFATCLIYLPQLPKLVGLVHILGQPACPEVVNQRPILGYIGRSPHGYLHLYRTHKTMAHHINSCHWTRCCSPCGSNGCTSCKVSWWANHGPAHTKYTASHPMVDVAHPSRAALHPPKVCHRLRAQQVTRSAMPVA